MTLKETIRILLVEDSQPQAKLIELSLHEQIGDAERFELTWVDRLEHAKEKLQDRPYDVVLLDLSLPDSEGPSTVRHIREAQPQVPIVVLTSREDEKMAALTLEQGAQDHLLKGDVAGKSLLRSIRYAMQRQAILSENQLLFARLSGANNKLEEQNNRLSELCQTARQFVDNVSHEFRTPLTVIKEFASIIRDGLAGEVTQEQREYLDIIGERVDDLAIMVNDLLDISKLEAGMLGLCRRVCSVSQILTRVRTTLERKAAAARVKLEIAEDDGIPPIFCDPEKAERVILNLVVNALKVSREESRVSLKARLGRDPSEVTFSVIDEGPGISPENLEAIFERFKQIDSYVRTSTKGFGLGLNIAKQLVQLNLGDISVRSRLNEGSAFVFTVPTANPSSLIQRYLRQIACLHPTGTDLTMLIVCAPACMGEKPLEELDYFLQHQMKHSEFAYRDKPHEWTLIVTRNREDTEEFIRQMRRTLDETNRNRPREALPELEFEVADSWKMWQDRELLAEAFRTRVDLTVACGA